MKASKSEGVGPIQPEATAEVGNSSLPGGEAVGVDKIRDLLFGNQMQDYDRRFSMLEERFLQRFREIESEAARNLSSFESSAKKQMESLAAQLSEEKDLRTDADKEIERTQREHSAGDCSTSTVTGVGTQTLMASQIGIDCAVVFSASPTSTQMHAIFEVAVPLLVTGRCFDGCPPGPNTDPAYFKFALTNKPGPVNNGVFTAFSSDDLGTELSPPGNFPSIGLAPTAGPLGSPPASGSSTFALCANLPAGNSNGQAPVPSVGAYYAMAASGEMFLSAPLPLPGVSSSMCPAL